MQESAHAEWRGEDGSGVYHLRVGRQRGESPTQWVETFASGAAARRARSGERGPTGGAAACSLYSVGAADTLRMSFDGNDGVQSIAYSTGGSCPAGPLPSRSISKFKTLYGTRDSEPGCVRNRLAPPPRLIRHPPSPEPYLESYVAEVKKKHEGAQAGGEQSQSFLGKYGMYLLPLCPSPSAAAPSPGRSTTHPPAADIALMFMNSGGQAAQGAGGDGGGATGGGGAGGGQ